MNSLGQHKILKYFVASMVHAIKRQKPREVETNRLRTTKNNAKSKRRMCPWKAEIAVRCSRLQARAAAISLSAIVFIPRFSKHDSAHMSRLRFVLASDYAFMILRERYISMFLSIFHLSNSSRAVGVRSILSCDLLKSYITREMATNAKRLIINLTEIKAKEKTIF